MLSRFNSLPLIALLSCVIVLSGCSVEGVTHFFNDNPSSVEKKKYDTSDGRYLPKPLDLEKEDSILETTRTGFKEIYVETRTDKYGSYAVFKLEYPSIDAVENKGVPQKTLTSAIEFYTDFVSLEVLDSIAFDDYSRYDDWVKNVAPQYIHKDYFRDVVTAQKAKTNTWHAVVFNNAIPNFSPPSNFELLPIFYRDGGPRVFNKKIWGLRATPKSDGSIEIYSQGSATMMTDQESHLQWDIKVNGKGFEDFPQFRDGPASTQMSFIFNIYLKKDQESWKVVDYDYNLTASVHELLEKTPKKLIKWREELKRSIQP